MGINIETRPLFLHDFRRDHYHSHGEWRESYEFLIVLSYLASIRDEFKSCINSRLEGGRYFSHDAHKWPSASSEKIYTTKDAQILIMLEYYRSLPLYLSATLGASRLFSPPFSPVFFPASRWIPIARHIECSFGSNTAGKIQSGVSAGDRGARLIELVVRDFPAGCGRLGRIIRCNPVGRRWEVEWFENCEGKGREKTRGDEHRRMKPVPRKAPYRGRRGTNLFAPRRLRNSNLPAPFFQPSFRRSLWVFLNAPRCSPSARKRRDSVGGKFRFYFPRMRQSPRALFHISFNRISFNYSSAICATPRN